MKRNAEPMEVDDELKGNAKKGKKASVFGIAVEDKVRPNAQHFNDSRKNMRKELTFFSQDRRIRQRLLRSSPAARNDLPMLELSWPGDGRDSWRATLAC